MPPEGPATKPDEPPPSRPPAPPSSPEPASPPEHDPPDADQILADLSRRAAHSLVALSAGDPDAWRAVTELLLDLARAGSAVDGPARDPAPLTSDPRI